MSEANEHYGRGKLIVFGEHAVVYGQRAVACSLPEGARASLRRSASPQWSITHPGGTLEIDEYVRRALQAIFDTFDLSSAEHTVDAELTIPVGAGLGSSAALAVAVARAAADIVGIDDDTARGRIDEAVAASEAVFHGTASGIDQTAAMGAGFFAYSKSHGWPEISSLDVPEHRWIIARVAPSASTARMVKSVADLHRRRPEWIDPLFERFDAIARAGCEALEAGRWRDVGTLMNLNHGLLNAIGVSTPALEAACHTARDAGANGAKLTGAGGGGCIIALADDEHGPDVEAALAEEGDVYSFTLPPTD